MMSEQAQILTTHNLAPLVDALNLREQIAAATPNHGAFPWPRYWAGGPVSRQLDLPDDAPIFPLISELPFPARKKMPDAHLASSSCRAGVQ